jgi:hypothetical protein
MPSGTGFVILHDDDNNYNCGIANDTTPHKTVGMNFELGMLVDSLPPSTRAALLDSIMTFFGIIPTGIEDIAKFGTVPTYTGMNLAYPNPGKKFIINYQIATTARIVLEIYDVTGRLVRELADVSQQAGYYSLNWNGCNTRGKRLPAGVYFIRFEAGNQAQVKKAILLR